MRTGLYFDMRNPVAWRRDPVTLYREFLDLCQEAERLGLDSVWVTEHHGFDDDYLPAPLTLLAAVAARTTRIRLGTGVVVAPLHRAAEIAEQAAVVDLLSGGRLDLGLGAGYRPAEFDLYGASLRARYAENDARAREVRELWRSGAVTPKPAQARLPIWMGYLGPKGARRAGLLGEHLLSADARNWEPYRAALAEAGHDPAGGRMAGGVQAWVTDDPDRDWPVVSRHLAAQVDSYARHARQGTALPPARPVDPERLRAGEPRTSLNYFFYGTPEDVAARIRAYTAGAPVDAVYLWAGLAGMDRELVARHITTIATRLAPLLRAAG
ncbi:LLM class flavin-dependent oxidoreductase [Amycolatopsis sp. NPDC026612]|uniref:LLM class flavin-dependent oxidoreductase n=1 Tax=Amycolatopsis sp. NPDC026612 TaxID=3155466 RepID=UPI0033C9BC11